MFRLGALVCLVLGSSLVLHRQLSNDARTVGFLSLQPAELWADVQVAGPDKFWSWLADENQRLHGQRRRASWGALQSQGAKGTLSENLRSDRRYYTAGIYGGFTNQFMMIANILYIARFSNRIPILPAFVAVVPQLGGFEYDLAVSELFDLSTLALSLGTPIVELHELRQTDSRQPERLKVVKFDGEFEQLDEEGRPLAVGDLIPAESAVVDNIGCWSWFQGVGTIGGGGVSRLTDAHWVPIPRSVYAEGNVHDGGADLVKLVEFVDHPPSEVPEGSFRILDEQNMERPAVLPSPSVFCQDSVYWYHELPHRWDLHSEWRAGDGVWATIGQHMRFQPGLVRLADDFLRHAFGLRASQPLPPFYAVHIRRGDFSAREWVGMSADHFAHEAWEGMQEIKQSLGVHIRHVVFTTDEQDPVWREPLVSYGWHFVDHTAAGTSEKFGHWLPTLLDTIILSRAFGFLGSGGSTMSITAMRRVIDWNGGFGRWIGGDHRLPEDWVWTW